MRDAVPFDAGAFGQDGDAALALQIVGVHGALGHVLVLAHRAGLLEQLVHQRGLAMVDMGDDGDVADFHGVPRWKARAYRRMPAWEQFHIWSSGGYNHMFFTKLCENPGTCCPIKLFHVGFSAMVAGGWVPLAPGTNRVLGDGSGASKFEAWSADGRPMRGLTWAI